MDHGTFSGTEDTLEVPNTTRLHSSIVQRALKEEKEACVLTPTAKPEYLPLVAANVLISTFGDERDSVFVLSADTEVRERFRQLAPSVGPDQRPFSEVEMPVANVTSEGKLSRVSEATKSTPRFLFSYTSKRHPVDEVGSRVACVIFDDSVKFTDERLQMLRDWRLRNDVPTIAYFTSDPLSDLYRAVKEDATTWTWPVELLDAAIRADERRYQDFTILDEEEGVPEADERVREQLRNRAQGVTVEVNVPGGENVETLFEEVQEARYEFEGLVHELDVDTLWSARGSLRYAIREIEELLTPIELAEFHSRRSISARINHLDRFASKISSDPDASPAVGTYRDVVSALDRLRDEWAEVPEGEKKEGQLVSHLLSVNEEEDSIGIVAPTESAAQAVASHLQSKYSSLYEQFGDDLQIHDPNSVRTSKPLDHVVLYGAPRYGDRDLLRLSVSPHVVILAYPSELRLLQSQVESLNEAFYEATKLQGWAVAESATKIAFGEDVTPHPERLAFEVPDPEERTKSDLVEDVEIHDEGEAADLADIVRTFDPDYLSPTDDPVDIADVSTSKSSSSTTTCTVFHVEDGGRLYHRPNDEVSVLRAEHQKILTMDASSVSPPEVVLHFEDTGGMRETLYGLIRERGDAELAFYASSWRVFLEQAIDERGDDLGDFIDRVEEQLDEDDYKVRQTYRNWYNLEVRRTRVKASMLAIAEAYDLEFVIENLDSVWDAVHEMENLYQKLKQALEGHALRAATTGEYEDVVVSENPRIQLSDFDIERHLRQFKILSLETLEDVPMHKIGMYET